MQKDDLVQYAEPMPDEIGLTFRILEVNGDRVLMEAIVKMNILPTCVELISNLKIAEG